MRDNMVLAVLTFVLLGVIVLRIQLSQNSRGKDGGDKMEPPESTLLT